MTTKLNTRVSIQSNKLDLRTSYVARLQHHTAIGAIASINCNRCHHSLVVKTQNETYIKQGCVLVQQKSPYKPCRSLHLWNGTLIFILVFSLAQSNSFFLHWFSLAVFLFLISTLLLSLLCHCLQFGLESESRHCAYIGGGGLPCTCCSREGGCQQRMHKNDWHFSDTHLGSDRLCGYGSVGFLQIKLQPQGGATDSGFLHSWPVSYSTVRWQFLQI